MRRRLVDGLAWAIIVVCFACVLAMGVTGCATVQRVPDPVADSVTPRIQCQFRQTCVPERGWSQQRFDI